MSLPQHIWDIIRYDPRFLAAGRRAQCNFIRQAQYATWDIGRENAHIAADIFKRSLDDVFGPYQNVMQGGRK